MYPPAVTALLTRRLGRAWQTKDNVDMAWNMAQAKDQNSLVARSGASAHATASVLGRGDVGRLRRGGGRRRGPPRCPSVAMTNVTRVLYMSPASIKTKLASIESGVYVKKRNAGGMWVG